MINYFKHYLPFRMLTALFIACYVAYYLLLTKSGLHTSISSIIAQAETTPTNKHLIILALLPVYIGCMIFGSALIGIYLGNTVPQLLMRSSKKSSKSN